MSGLDSQVNSLKSPDLLGDSATARDTHSLFSQSISDLNSHLLLLIKCMRSYHYANEKLYFFHQIQSTCSSIHSLLSKLNYPSKPTNSANLTNASCPFWSRLKTPASSKTRAKTLPT